MKESEYVAVRNSAHLSSALHSLREVFMCKYISDEKLSDMKLVLYEAIQKCLRDCETEED